MKITTILGSPRRAGNTAAILRAFEELASGGNQILRIEVAGRNVGGCRGCDACQKVLDAPGCALKDDFLDIAARILDSDVVVYAAPVYVWDFPAQMKALMDRHYCLVKHKAPEPTRYLIRGTRAMLLATSGGDAESNTDLIQEVFRREMEYLHCQVIGCYTAGSCASPSTLGRMPQDIAERMMADLGLP